MFPTFSEARPSLHLTDEQIEDACIDALLDELMAQHEDRPTSQCDCPF
jgi:hypothetical protein